MKVFIVTSGEYSDEGNEAVFSSRAKAEECVKLSKEYTKYYGFNEYIEEFDLDPDIQFPHFKFKNFYYIIMEKDGNIVHISEHYPSNIFDTIKNIETLSFGIGSGMYQTNLPKNNKDVNLRGVVNANDRLHAVKILNDKRRQLIAENRWIDSLVGDKPYIDVKI